MQFAPAWQVEPALKPSHYVAFSPSRRALPQRPNVSFEHRMTPFGRNIEERP